MLVVIGNYWTAQNPALFALDCSRKISGQSCLLLIACDMTLLLWI
jgi:hypothetical protein